MPAFNAASFIESAIQSVLQQTFSDWELLITDDCSTDDTVNIIQCWQQNDTRIKCFQTSANSGPAVARNVSISHSKGRYLAFLDSDDLWHLDKLTKQVAYMKQHNIPFTFTSYLRKTSSSERIIKSIPKMTYQQLCYDTRIATPTVMIDTHEIGEVKMKKVYYEDLALWLEIIRKGFEFHGLPEVLTIVNIRKNSISRNKLLAPARLWEVICITEKNNRLYSVYYLFLYIGSLSIKFYKNKFNIDD